MRVGRIRTAEDACDEGARLVYLVRFHVSRGERGRGTRVARLCRNHHFELPNAYLKLVRLKKSKTEDIVCKRASRLGRDDLPGLPSCIAIAFCLEVRHRQVQADVRLRRSEPERLHEQPDRAIIVTQFAVNQPEIRKCIETDGRTGQERFIRACCNPELPLLVLV
jgi:hypothetical protein